MDTTATGDAAESADAAAAALLMARLQSQFGDMNVTAFLSNEGGAGVPSGDENQEEDEESSLEEPSPEELRAWQETQFQKGKVHNETKAILREAEEEGKKVGDRARCRSALQRRRKHTCAVDEDDEGWERVASVPDLDGGTSQFFPKTTVGGELVVGAHPLLRELARKGDPDVLGTKWSQLYSSAGGDGLSFRSICEGMRGYDGPTVLLVGGTPSASRCLNDDDSDGQCAKRVALGFFAMDPWTESADAFGEDEDCFLFALDEDACDVTIFRPKARTEAEMRERLRGRVGTSVGVDDGSAPGRSSSRQSRRYMYCRPSTLTATKLHRQTGSSSGTTDGSLHGIGIGGNSSQPRLHLTETLEECRALPHDALFDDGDLLLRRCDNSLYYFDADIVEVWGVGGEEWIADAKAAQTSEREVREANLAQVRRVDKAQFLDDFRNGVVWKGSNEPTLFRHRDVMEERCEM